MKNHLISDKLVRISLTCLIGDRVAFWVRPYKKKIGVCEHCGPNFTGHLEFAHKHEFHRSTVINKDIDNGLTPDEIYTKWENLHKDEPETLGLVLCKKCHNKYDNRGEK